MNNKQVNMSMDIADQIKIINEKKKKNILGVLSNIDMHHKTWIYIILFFDLNQTILCKATMSHYYCEIMNVN